jgi:hypothetical protein
LWIDSLSSLEHVSIAGPSLRTLNTFDTFAPCSLHLDCPFLPTLNCNYWFESGRLVQAHLHCNAMHSLDLSGCEGMQSLEVSAAGLQNLRLRGCKGLRHLKIRHHGDHTTPTMAQVSYLRMCMLRYYTQYSTFP